MTTNQNARSISSFRGHYWNIQVYRVKNPHNIWSCINPLEHEVKRAEIKARMVTGTYMLQSNISRYNQQEVPATCQICKDEDETLNHMLLKCAAFTGERAAFTGKLTQVLGSRNSGKWDTILNNNLLLQLILDCTHPDVTVIIGDEQRLLSDTRKSHTSLLPRDPYAESWLPRL